MDIAPPFISWSSSMTMEPVSFSIAVTSLAVLVSTSTRNIHTLWCKFKDFDEQLKRLHSTASCTEALLGEMSSVVQSFHAGEIPENLLSLWSLTDARARADLGSFNYEVEKILRFPRDDGITKFKFRSRLMHFISENNLELYHQRLILLTEDLDKILGLMHK